MAIEVWGKQNSLRDSARSKKVGKFSNVVVLLQSAIVILVIIYFKSSYFHCCARCKNEQTFAVSL